jgi:hypothetical protein
MVTFVLLKLHRRLLHGPFGSHARYVILREPERSQDSVVVFAKSRWGCHPGFGVRHREGLADGLEELTLAADLDCRDQAPRRKI